jgi:hypothetical protein
MVNLDSPFKPGDRVTRPVDVYDSKSPIRHGVVVRRYGKAWYRGDSDWPTGYDPELYEVKWDDGTAGKGFFRHGLDRE